MPRLVHGALVIAALSATACDRGSGREGQASSLTVLFQGDERSWAFYLPAQFLVFLPLAQRGEDGQLHGWLARSWEHSGDWRTWTVHVRSDVKWHDGMLVTAHDVKFSLDLRAHPAVGGEAPNSFSVDVLDDTTVTIAFRRKPSEYWLYFGPIYPKHLLEKLDPEKFYDWDFWTRPVGAGPYRYVRHLPKTMMEFAANQEYFLGKPRIDRLVLKYGEPVITELLSGNVDAIPAVQEMELLKPTADLDEEDRLYGELAEIFRAELPLTRLVFMHDVTFAHRRIRGLSTPFRADAKTNIEKLWVDEEVPR
ncbi:MAG: ABC transporter substrate-binding protein [Gemmatimonadaceae bacterium]